jgi:hypothetical protein
MKKAIVFGIALLICGCKEKTLEVVSCRDLGVVTSARALATAWNAWDRLEVVSERAVTIVLGYPVIELGRRSWLVDCSDGSQWLYLEGTHSLLLIGPTRMPSGKRRPSSRSIVGLHGAPFD